MSEQYQTERIVIDPQRLLLLKRERKSLKMVPSIFEPPQQDKPFSKIQPIAITLPSPSAPEKFSTEVPNVEFIISLLPSNQIGDIYYFEEGDCIPWEVQDRWLLIDGQIKVTGLNGFSFIMPKGYLFFLTKQTKRKVKEVISITSTKLARIPSGAVQQYIRNYLFIKNAQKIKYLKYCPFLIWNEHLCQDLSLCMEMIQVEKDQYIYRENQEAQDIYFVKEGIVLLQRSMKITNQIVKDYQMHYQKDQANQNDVLLVVRKGMVFGIDGVLLKQKNQSSKSFRRYHSRKSSIESSSKPLTSKHTQINNDPQQQIKEIKKQQIQQSPIKVIKAKQNSTIQKQQKNNDPHKSNSRIYSAKTMGRSEIFKMKKSVLATFFNIQDMLRVPPKNREISSKELDRICYQYTSLVSGNRHITKSLRSLEFAFKGVDNNPELQIKKAKVQNVKDFERNMRKISMQAAMKIKNDGKNDSKLNEIENPFKYSPKAQKNNKLHNKNQNSNEKLLNAQKSQIILPILRKQDLQKIIMSRKRGPQQKQIQQYKQLKKYVQEQILDKHKLKQEKQSPRKQRMRQSQQLSVKVKSYRSILTSLG